METSRTFFLTLSWVLTPETPPESHGEQPRQIPHISGKGREKVTFLNMPSAFSITKAYSLLKEFYRSLISQRQKGAYLTGAPSRLLEEGERKRKERDSPLLT